MTKKAGKLYIIGTREEETGRCKMCGAVDEVRPYGPGGMIVCFDCAMKDEAEARRQFAARLGDATTVVVKND